jgi:hypothetical protein
MNPMAFESSLMSYYGQSEEMAPVATLSQESEPL